MSKLIEYPSRQNVRWTLRVDDDDSAPIETIQAFVLMDIREELRTLNALLHCSHFTGIPQTLRSIRGRMGPVKPKQKAKR